MKNGQHDGPRICPSCKSLSLERQFVNDRFEYGAEDKTVWVEAENVPIEVCARCHETFRGPEAARVRHDAICKTLGLLTPAEIRNLRERLHMTQEQFAEWASVGVATVSRWERGCWIQTRAHDRLMRTLDENRVLREVVESIPEAKRSLQRRLVASGNG